MMEEDKIEITNEMLEGFSNMIKSSAQDTILVVDILNNRDKNNLESEANFQKLSKMIIDDNKLFPLISSYAIKMDGKLLVLGNNKAIFNSIAADERSLSTHLTKYLGKSAKNLSLDWSQKGLIKSKSEEYHINYKGQRMKNPLYDNKFDKKKYIQELKNKQAEDIGYLAGRDMNPHYFKAMKMVFKGGKELRDFLMANKILEIVQL